MKRAIIWSWGGGVQTIAILVLIAQGKLPKPELAIMADTGRERTSTWRYFSEHAKPILDNLSIPFVVASHNLAKVDLYAHNGNLLIPVFTKGGKLPTFCSYEWKKRVVLRKLRELGYGPKKPVQTWIGMSLNEVHRMKVSDRKWTSNHYPLIVDVPKRRNECVLTITDFGLPEPANSSCWMCPNMNNKEWAEIKRDDPHDFAAAIKLEKNMTAKDSQGGVYLHSDRISIDQADLTVKAKPLPLFECADTCWT